VTSGEASPEPSGEAVSPEISGESAPAEEAAPAEKTAPSGEPSAQDGAVSLEKGSPEDGDEEDREGDAVAHPTINEKKAD
jgi:hypothetical protein